MRVWLRRKSRTVRNPDGTPVDFEGRNWIPEDHPASPVNVPSNRNALRMVNIEDPDPVKRPVVETAPVEDEEIREMIEGLVAEKPKRKPRKKAE
jgi:hypothetical protein